MKKKILIVDDNSANLYLMQSLLEGEGFDVRSAENGQAALDIAHTDPPDMIVSDILMPVMDGYTLCRQCKEDEQLRQIPFMFYTATYTEPKDEKFALSLGADRFVLKPQEPETLIRMLKEIWEERSTAKPVAPKPLGEELEFFRQYNEVLFRKLEKKMLDLETANRKLKCLEEQYRLSFENVTDIIWTIDTDLIVRKMSPSVERMLGYGSKDFIGRSVSEWVKILTPESMERAMAEISSVLSGQTISTSVYSLVARDGTVKYGEISGAPILRNGDIVGMVSMIRDITERMQTEKVLRLQQERLDLAQSAGKVGVFDWDMVTDSSTWTPQLEILYGIEPGSVEHTSKDWITRVHPDDLKEAESRVRQCIRERLPEIAGDYRIVRPDGEIRWLSNRASIFYDASGKPVRMVGTSADITERKQAEEKLRESGKKYHELYDFLPIPVYEMDLEANITSANRAIYETFGGTEGDLKKGFNAWQLLSPENIEKSSKNIERLLQGEKIEGTEYTLKRLDGSLFPAIVISSVIYSNGKPVGLRGAIIDIAELKQAEEKLRESETRFREMFDNAPIGYHELDAEGRVTRINHTELAMLGYSAEETLGKHVWDFIGEKDISRKAVLDKLAGTLPPGRNFERTYCKKDGAGIPVLIQDLLIRDKNGIITGIRTTIQDITELKRADEMLLKTTERLRRLLDGTVQAISMAVETRDPYTAGHQRRSADLARSIATEMGLSADRKDFIGVVAAIHDIGKIAVPAEILSKPTKLTNIEFGLIKIHPHAGHDILQDIEFPWPVAEVILQHHERMDGSGYPRGLKGEDILMEARIVSVADVVEAIASHRPYRPALGIEAALEEIQKNRGLLYDPEAVDACLKLFHEKGYNLR